MMASMSSTNPYVPSSQQHPHPLSDGTKETARIAYERIHRQTRSSQRTASEPSLPKHHPDGFDYNAITEARSPCLPSSMIASATERD